jgi:hypothetical protein
MEADAMYRCPLSPWHGKRPLCLMVFVAALLSAPAFAQIPQPVVPVTAHEITGFWNPIYHEDVWDRRTGRALGDFTGLPLSEAGRLASATWDPGRLSIPETQCRPHPGIYGMRGMARLHIVENIDPVNEQLVAYEIFYSLGGRRTIWMDGRPHPPDYAAHTYAGFSTGRWDGNTLVVRTTHNKVGYNNRNGSPFSDQAEALEHFTRQGDMLLMTSFIIDPMYLEEPLIRTTNWTLDTEQVGGRAANAFSCSPLDVIDQAPGRAKHAVPHFLPGQFEQHREFQQKFNISEEAAFGGSETLYPEYAAQIEEWRVAEATRVGSRARPVAGGTEGQSSFSGSWALNRARSTFQVSWVREAFEGRDGTAPEYRIMRFQSAPDGALTHVIDTRVGAGDSGFHRVEYTARFDGRDYPTKGGAIETFSLRRVDANTIERTGKIKGQVVETATWTLSPDGKVMTVSASGTMEGASYKNLQVFERIGE